MQAVNIISNIFNIKKDAYIENAKPVFIFKKNYVKYGNP
ncbi:hypothetical protein BC749_1244 [Flavobacterium araucananum]|nr:hypothetical protein BC749_1244 [Flavobacterium araucananum]